MATSGASRYSGSSQTSSIANPPPRSSSYNFSAENISPRPAAVSEESIPIETTPGFELVPSRRLEHTEKDTTQSGVYHVDTSPASTTLASRHGKFHVKVWDLPSGALLTTIKVPFYVQMQPRSREFFIRSHTILSETLNLVAIATGFGQNLEIWNWARKKKVQTLSNAHRWAAVKAELHDDARPLPLATYREDDDTISLYPVCADLAKKPFGKPRVLDLRRAGLPHVPKLPELAYSATGPLLVAAAGPRPPRPNAAPPAHAALLVVWRLDTGSNRPYKLLQTATGANGGAHPELENSLPLCLATYGSVAVSIWEPAKFRTIGRPGMWQVEPVPVTGRVVLVWDFGGGGATGGDDNNTNNNKVTTYKIPHALSCVSPDCRFVAYCDAGGQGRDGALVVLDAIRGGRELWRLDGAGKDEAGPSGRSSSRRSGKSFETRSSGRSSSRSEGSSFALGGAGLESLAANLHKVTELAFSGDGKSLFVGDIDGNVGVYELREGSAPSGIGIGIAV